MTGSNDDTIGLSEGPRQARRSGMSRRHSLAKTVSWRVTATIDTFIISFFVTGSFAWAGSIAGLEVLTKMGLYYLHERAWARIQWGHE